MVLFSAVLHRERVTVAQLRVPAGTTETTQVTALLAPVDLRAVVVTADAAHTCRATAAYLVEQRHADYVLSVEGDRAALLAGPVSSAARGPRSGGARPQRAFPRSDRPPVGLDRPGA